MRVRPLELFLITVTSAITITLALGCGPGPEPVETDCEEGTTPGQPAVNLGTRQDDRFVAFSGESSPLALHSGAQGGQHVYVSTQLYAGKSGRFRERLFLKDGTKELGQGQATVEACDEGWTVSHQITLFIDTATTTGGLLTVETYEIDESGLMRGPKIEASALIRISR
ncbi:MAG: hypothetical protein IPG45_35095 [Deltaproteobacteria bacterium]|jgi:hypothetical protein|nr:hypothetical protein [Deltaproteobacteria bacterium]